MPDPVFTEADRVASTAGLPKELEGKTPAQIAEYYQKREKQIITEARKAIGENNVNALPNDQQQRQQQQQQIVDPEFVNNATATLIETAKRAASAGKKYWDRLLPEIETIMKGVDPKGQVNLTYWETAYYTLLGQQKDKLEKEDADAAATAARLTAERASGGSESAPIPEALPIAVTTKVLPGLGITEKQYRDGQKNMDEGKWPLTFDKSGRA